MIVTHVVTNQFSLHDFKKQINLYALERDAAVAKATSALGIGGKRGGLEPNRTRRADVSSIQRQVSKLIDGLASLRKDNELSEILIIRLVIS